MIHVVKIGGNVVDHPDLLAQFVGDFAALEGPKVLVHGGGVLASQLQERLGLTPRLVEGRRVTDADTLRLVTMVYAGWCNKHLVALLQAAGCNAIGLAGCDGNVIRADKRPPRVVEGVPVDYGFVGDVTVEGIRADFIGSLLAAGLTPVFSAINHDGRGRLLNTNADTIAACVATALAAVQPVTLTYCFEKPGVLHDRTDDGSVIATLTPASYAALKAEGRVADGMLPKLDNAFEAIARGVSAVRIKHAANLSNAIGTTLLP